MPGKGRPFKKGNKFGKGRPPLPKDVRKVKSLAKSQVEMRMIEMLAMSRKEIADIMKRDDAEMIDLLLGSIITKGVQKGDQHRLSFLLDRLIGKVKDVSVVEMPEDGAGTLVGVAYVPRSKRAK